MKLETIRIGDVLKDRGLITEEQLNTALEKQHDTGGKLGEIVVDLGFIDKKTLLEALAGQLKIPYVDVNDYQFDRELVRKLPENSARRYKMIILQDNNEDILLGMANPQDIFAIDEAERILGRRVKAALVDGSELDNNINLLYDQTSKISRFAKELSAEMESAGVFNLDEGLGDPNAPVVKLLQSLFDEAIRLRASDVHIEPDEGELHIRLRVDGVLQRQAFKDKSIAQALVQRLKLMAGLDIAEKRLPQDGHFNMKVKGEAVDVRLSTMPTIYGESVVMRLLQQSAANRITLDNCGMPPEMLERFRHIIHRPHGMVLVTGPTGSGKTTTLYGALNELNTVSEKIITVEDPVEYHIQGITQVQVNPKIDLTFARVLRSALRQDPDIMMVGEIRDAESASIGLRSAMTGHLVLATLHTTDARSSAMRLIDMGAESYLVAFAIRAVIAQRLIRRICRKCTEPYTPTVAEIEWMKSALKKHYKDDMLEKLRHGQGCSYCNQTGYSGRVGIYELLEFNQEMLAGLRRNDSDMFLAAVDKDPNARPLSLRGLDVALTGVTTLEEVMRIAEDIEEMEK